MRSENRTTREHRATIHAIAAESFAQHTLVEVGTVGDTRVWKCKRPGTGIYHFRVIAWPGWIAVAGDVGDTLFRHSDDNTIGWLRGAIDDTQYLLGKVQNPHKVFMAGDALAFIDEIATNYGDDKRSRLGDKHHSVPKRSECESDEQFDALLRDALADVADDNRTFDDEAKQYRERAAKIRETWSADDGHEAFHRACRDADEDDPPDCTDHESNHLWAVEALRCFLRLLDAKPVAEAAHVV